MSSGCKDQTVMISSNFFPITAENQVWRTDDQNNELNDAKKVHWGWRSSFDPFLICKNWLVHKGEEQAGKLGLCLTQYQLIIKNSINID